MSAAAAWDTHLRELRTGPTDTPGFDGALDLLSTSALEADGEGRQAMVRAGAWEVLLRCAEDAVAGGQWARASKAASSARTVAADPKTRTVLARSDAFQTVEAEELVEFEFSYNSAEIDSRMPETIPVLLRLARAGGHGEGADADMVRYQALQMLAGIFDFTEAMWTAGREQLVVLLAEVVEGGGKGFGGGSARLTALVGLNSLAEGDNNDILCGKLREAKLQQRVVETLVHTAPRVGPVGNALCLQMLLNLADCEDIAPEIIGAGAIELARDAYAHADARNPLPTFSASGATMTVGEMANGVLTNLCQHEALHAELLRADVPAALLPMTTDPNEEIAFSTLLALAFMLGGSDDKNNPHIVAASAAVTRLCETLRHGGIFFTSTGEETGSVFSIVELLNPAVKMVINDDNKQQMHDVGMLPVLETVLAQQMPGEEEAEEGAAHKIVSILLHLSFLSAGLDWLVARKNAPDSTLHTNLDTLANTDGAGQAGRDAGSLCFRISKHSYSSGVTSPGTDLARHVMVSYCWAQKAIVLQFCKTLREMGHEVWRDEEGSKYVGPISGSTIGAMADAVDKASSVVVFVSRAYKESANCRLEATYAHGGAKDGLKMLYVMCEEDYTTVSKERVTGWLGFLIGQELWYPAWKDPAEAARAVSSKLTQNSVLTTPAKVVREREGKRKRDRERARESLSLSLYVWLRT